MVDQSSSSDIAPAKLYFNYDENLAKKIMETIAKVQEEKKRPAYVFDIQKKFILEGLKTPMLITR